MKAGRPINAIAQELMRQAESKRDMVADTRRLEISADATHLIVAKVNDAFTISDNAHRQIGARTGIPAIYYDRMRKDAPDLLRTNLLTWWNQSPEPRMVRTLDGRARAYLSDRYHRLDHVDVAQTLLPILMEDESELRIESAEVTDDRLYIKAVSPKVQGEVRKGDVVQAGLLIKNSEVGLGSLSVTPLIYRLVCTNGMVCADGRFSKNHVGAKLDETAEGFMSDETKDATDKAILLQARDIVKASLDPAAFQARLEKLAEAAGQKIERDPIETVELAAKTFRFTESEKGGVLRRLLESGDLSKYGLANAVTRHAQEVESYDRSTEMEAIGGKVIELPRTEWRALAA